VLNHRGRRLGGCAPQRDDGIVSQAEPRGVDPEPTRDAGVLERHFIFKIDTAQTHRGAGDRFGVDARLATQIGKSRPEDFSLSLPRLSDDRASGATRASQHGAIAPDEDAQSLIATAVYANEVLVHQGN
jgi:hypothetical protein